MADWKEYELAVSKFISAIDQNAKVTYNALLPDKHTQYKRQRDVFIEAIACNLFPIKILVSCKKYKRKLNQQDIDAFNGELISSEAHKGVIYSYSGFNKNAIKKCKVLGVSCCKLYQNEPPDIPEVLPICSVYACYPQMNLLVIDYLDPQWGFSNWGDLFKEPIGNLDNKTVIDEIARVYKDCEKEAVEMSKKNFFPGNYTGIIQLNHEKKEIAPIKVRISCFWRIYQGDIKASLINGSYSFSEAIFVGSQCLPSIDIQESRAGKGWALLEKQPDTPSDNRVVYIVSDGDAKEALINNSTKLIKVVQESNKSLPSK